MLAGDGTPDIAAQGAAVTNARRRIFASRRIDAGATIRELDLIPLRADSGIEVSNWDRVVGAIATTDVERGQPILSEGLKFSEGQV
jgi:sialic acid synthase SpsE